MRIDPKNAPTRWLILVTAGLLMVPQLLAARTDSSQTLASILDEAREAGELLSGVAAYRRHEDVEVVTTGQLAPDSPARPGASTSYQIGSITKALTNLLLAEMVARGQVRYDTTIGELLGGEVAFANEAVGRITLQELATHTSGLPRLPTNLEAAGTAQPYAQYDEAALFEALATVREDQPLGKSYAYSNLGLGLLGHLLGRLHGEGYPAALEALVLEPLGLEETGFAPSDPVAAGYSGGEVAQAWTFDALAGAGALWSTGGDLVRLGSVQLGYHQSGLAHDLAEDLDVVVEGAGPFSLSRVWHVAESAEGPVYWHNGATAGYKAFFGFRPETKEALALLFAGDLDPLGVASIWFGLEMKVPAAPEVDPAITGQYRLTPGVGIGVFAGDRGPVAQLSGQSPVEIEALDGGWYRLKAADASLHFLREDGRVTAVEFVQRGRVQRAEKVADTAEVLARREIELSSEDLADYVGEYALSPQARFTIRRADDGLEARLTGQPFFRIFARSEDVFFYKVVDAELHFERNEAGEIDALVLHQGGIEQRAERVD